MRHNRDKQKNILSHYLYAFLIDLPEKINDFFVASE